MDITDTFSNVEKELYNFIKTMEKLEQHATLTKLTDAELMSNALFDYVFNNNLAASSEVLRLRSVHTIDFKDVLNLTNLSKDLVRSIVDSYLYGMFYFCDVTVLIKYRDLVKSWIVENRDVPTIVENIIQSGSLIGEDIVYFIDESEARNMVEDIVEKALNVILDHFKDIIKVDDNVHLISIGWKMDNLVMVLSDIVSIEETYTTKE